MPLFRGRESQPAPAPPAPAPGPAPASPAPVPVTPAPPVVTAPGELPDAALADAMSYLWRAGRKLAAAEDSSGAVRQAARHLRAAGDAFAAAGVTVQDHDGTAFDAGLALEVVAYEPRPGARGETVLETVRPCVYRAGRRIQVGQVIVATPEAT